MESARSITLIVLKAVAVGASVTSIILGIVGLVGIEVQVTLLSVGLATLAVASLSEEGDEVESQSG